MSFVSNEFPGTSYYRSDLRKVLEEIRRLTLDIEGIEERVKSAVLSETKEYVDAELNSVRRDFDKLRLKVTDLTIEVETFETNIREYLEARLTFISYRVDQLDKKIDNAIIGVNARTDLAIQQNNEYLLDHITDKLLPGMRVINMFTGERVTVQNMFNYLGSLHTDDGATINYVVSQDKTVDEIIAIDASCTNWVLHGRTLLA